MYDIIAIGSATRDNFLRADFKLIDWPATQSGKAITLPFGEKISVKEYVGTIGGNAVNASVTFARQGLKAACCAKIGDDLAGDELIARLKKEKVDAKLIKRAGEKPTAYSTLLLSETGERTILGYHGASDTFKIENLKIKNLRAKWWYLSLAGESAAMLPELIKFARENKIKVAFNPSSHHIKNKKQEILDVLKDLAFLVLNESEAAELLGIPFSEEEKVFKKLDELTPGIVAVTNGPKGVAVSDGKNIYKAGIFPERKLIDRTGAGDAFGSGFVAGLIQNEYPTSHVTHPASNAIEYAIRLASANATSVVEQVGATEGMLTKEQFTNDPRWQKFQILIK